MKPSDYNVTKKEDTIAGSDGICIFVFGTQDEFRDCVNSSVGGLEQIVESVFSFLLG